MDEMTPGDDFMEIIMGLGGPTEPGHHGKDKLKGMSHESCCEFIAKVRDLCDEFLMQAGKDDEKPEKEDEEDTEDSEEMDEEE